MADYNYDFQFNMDKFKYERMLYEQQQKFLDKPTHILGFPLGALCRGKKGTRYEGHEGIIEIWDRRDYDGWVTARKIPIRYTKGRTNIEIDGVYYNGISKIRFAENWEIVKRPHSDSDADQPPEQDVIEI